MNTKTAIVTINIATLIATVYLICHFNNWLWVLFYVVFHMYEIKEYGE